MNTPADAPNDLLTPQEVADIMGVRPETVARWTREGHLVAQGKTLGGHRRYARQEVNRLLAETATDVNPGHAGHAEHPDAEEAVRLYQEGWSILRVAKKFNVSYGYMRQLLRKHTTVRPRGGSHAPAPASNEESENTKDSTVTAYMDMNQGHSPVQAQQLTRPESDSTTTRPDPAPHQRPDLLPIRPHPRLKNPPPMDNTTANQLAITASHLHMTAIRISGSGITADDLLSITTYLNALTAHCRQITSLALSAAGDADPQHPIRNEPHGTNVRTALSHAQALSDALTHFTSNAERDLASMRNPTPTPGNP